MNDPTTTMRRASATDNLSAARNALAAALPTLRASLRELDAVEILVALPLLHEITKSYEGLENLLKARVERSKAKT